MTQTTPAANRRRILFVDDEPAILQGLRASLHRERKRWDMVFANGADEALAHMRSGEFEVVVSDMRMPKVDGATLLGIVRRDYPATARVILSGHAERDSIVRALPSMHQFLSKPCTPDRLCEAIERCLASPDMDPRLRALIGRLDRLPSPAELGGALEEFASRPDGTLAEATALIARDTAVAAKVMQIANSAAFGTPGRSTSLVQAVQFLGVDLLRAITVGSGLFEATGDAAAALTEIQGHAVRGAAIAARATAGTPDVDQAFVAALLRDVGRIVLVVGMPGEYRAMVDEVAATGPLTGARICAAEARVFGADHATVGATLLRMWGLPESIVDLVAHHHTPERAKAAPALIAAVHAAAG
jgi:HD-like signal output (HDOD) protein|nr:HDOD domain-containing protein [Kofleriaceae bacterium]